MDICTYILSLMVVGAVEVAPGTMHVEVLNPRTQTIREIYVPTDRYLDCWQRPLSL